MTKDIKEIDFSSGIKLSDKTFYMYRVYNPDLPNITYEEAARKGIEPNPTILFSEKEKLDISDLPKGYKLFKKSGVNNYD